MLGCFIIKYILESRDRKLMKAIDSKKFLDIKDIKIKSVETIGNIGLEKKKKLSTFTWHKLAQ